MRPSNEALERYLSLFPEVRWDRYIELSQEFDVYGWIDRDDNWSDFFLFEVTPKKDDGWVWCFVTSSAHWSAEFSRRLDEFEGIKSNHTDCQRVEELGLNVNAIRLEADD